MTSRMIWIASASRASRCVSVRAVIRVRRASALRLLGGQDVDQLDLKEQRRAVRYRAAAGAISELGGNRELPALADTHHRDAFLPAADQAAEREGRRLAPLDRGVEHLAIGETADIMDHHLVGDRRALAGAAA